MVWDGVEIAQMHVSHLHTISVDVIGMLEGGLEGGTLALQVWEGGSRGGTAFLNLLSSGLGECEFHIGVMGVATCMIFSLLLSPRCYVCSENGGRSLGRQSS